MFSRVNDFFFRQINNELIHTNVPCDWLIVIWFDDMEPLWDRPISVTVMKVFGLAHWVLGRVLTTLKKVIFCCIWYHVSYFLNN